MFWDDHAPPHFHALYGEYEVLINIATLDVIKGKMPRRALALVLEWAAEHRQAVVVCFALCRIPVYLNKFIWNMVLSHGRARSI